jgi:biotin-dependent carboxylase-like uncharacterized protein
VLTVDGRATPSNAAFVVTAGARLRFGRRSRGARAYIAINGGVDTPVTLGSRATHLTAVMGGIDGRALKAGDHLPLGDPTQSRTLVGADRQPVAIELPQGEARLRVLPGPQLEYFAPDALAVLQSASYAISHASDRMAFRLEGPRLTHARGADIISDATPIGALQVPASGQPILLMADRQTSGGYPKIATVISADICVAGQLAPGDRIAFSVCSLHDALGALIARERALMAVETPAS